jgi:predicted phosphodiesterase
MVGAAALRIGLISDCEGNVAALTAALAAIRSHTPDLIIHAGDILASPFSPDPPHETIALLRSEPILAIPGNNDRYLIDWGTPRWPHTLWLRRRRPDPARFLDQVGPGQDALAPADLVWLRALPEEVLVTEGVWLCHGMPGNPFNSIWPRHAYYDACVSDADRAASLAMLAEVDAGLVLCGHVPQPSAYWDRLPDGRELRVVRAGPRDMERVGYAILTRTAGRWAVAWHEVEITAAIWRM